MPANLLHWFVCPSLDLYRCSQDTLEKASLQSWGCPHLRPVAARLVSPANGHRRVVFLQSAKSEFTQKRNQNIAHLRARFRDCDQEEGKNEPEQTSALAVVHRGSLQRKKFTFGFGEKQFPKAFTLMIIVSGLWRGNFYPLLVARMPLISLGISLPISAASSRPSILPCICSVPRSKKRFACQISFNTHLWCRFTSTQYLWSRLHARATRILRDCGNRIVRFIVLCSIPWTR